MAPKARHGFHALTLGDVDELVLECTRDSSITITPEIFQMLRLRHARYLFGKELLVVLRDRYGISAMRETCELMHALENLLSRMLNIPELAKREADYLNGLLTNDEIREARAASSRHPNSTAT